MTHERGRHLGADDTPGLDGHRTLIVVAAPSEAAAVASAFGLAAALEAWRLVELDARHDLVVCGVGKANAAGAVGRFADPRRHRAILSAGIAGALPVGNGLWAVPIGAVVVASSCDYADEGIETPTGFSDCGEMGFPLGDFPGRSVPVGERLLEGLRPHADRVGPIATVSTCSGTDALAARVVERTGAIAEAMEGAAVVQTARRLGLPAGELRVISNTTGERGKQLWDVRAALDRLTEVFGRVSLRD